MYVCIFVSLCPCINVLIDYMSIFVSDYYKPSLIISVCIFLVIDVSMKLFAYFLSMYISISRSTIVSIYLTMYICINVYILTCSEIFNI